MPTTMPGGPVALLPQSVLNTSLAAEAGLEITTEASICLRLETPLLSPIFTNIEFLKVFF